MDAIEDLLERTARLLTAMSDVLDGRVRDTVPPRWCESRGWSSFLLSLDDEAVHEAERVGLPAVDLSRAPDDLRRVCDDIAAITAPFAHMPNAPPAIESDHVPLRKRPQVASLAAHLARLALPVTRVVDVGAGHGHLARALRLTLDVQTLGIEGDVDRVMVARSLARDRDIAFEHQFIGDGKGTLSLETGDLVVGLHACGALGDAMLRAAAAARARVVLVSCCQQKIDTPRREALSTRGQRLGLSYRRELLGLSNLAWGVGTAVSMRARATRHALRLLLRSRGITATEGDVAHGINKKRFRKDLATVAETAFAARGLAPATVEELTSHEALGRRAFGRIRRLSLPRNMLGRVLEIAIVLDRSAYLQEHDFDVSMVPMFDVDVSPRNLGIVGSAR